MSIKQKEWIVLKTLQDRADEDEIMLHPESESICDIKIVDLDSILLKLEKNKVIEILSSSSQSKLNNPFEGFSKTFSEISYSAQSFNLKLTEKFESYLREFQEKYKIYIPENNTAVNEDTKLWISYSKNSREILLNDIFLISKPHFGKVNDLVFSYLYENPNKLISKSELEKNATKGPIEKSLNSIIQQLGFEKDLRKIFIIVNKNHIQLNNPVTKKYLSELQISKINIKAR